MGQHACAHLDQQDDGLALKVLMRQSLMVGGVRVEKIYAIGHVRCSATQTLKESTQIDWTGVHQAQPASPFQEVISFSTCRSRTHLPSVCCDERCGVHLVKVVDSNRHQILR